MADKDLELGIVLDTSEAESSLKSLEDAVPKSLKRLNKNFAANLLAGKNKNFQNGKGWAV